MHLARPGICRRIRSMRAVDLFLTLTLVVTSWSDRALAGERPNLEAEVKYEWNQIEYMYLNQFTKDTYLKNPLFLIPENIQISGIAVHNNVVYVTIPRVKSAVGVPWVLTRVYMYLGKPLLMPYPNYKLQPVGDCTAIQNPLAMEIDHNTGYLYVLDSGRSGIADAIPTNVCPAKIVVYNTANTQVVGTHVLPETLVSRTSSILSSFVLDYTVPGGNKVRYAYISDAGLNQLIVYDFTTSQTWSFTHPSMLFNDSADVTINGQGFHIGLGISGLALSPDFNYLYWTCLWSDRLYQTATWILRRPGQLSESSVRLVGRKVSNTDAMIHGKDSLYYGALQLDAVYRWEKRHDMMDQNVPEDKVEMITQRQLVQNWESIQWPDSLSIDDRGNLWFTTGRAHLFISGQMNFSDPTTSNFRIFKLPVNDFSYLDDNLPTGAVVG
ncbi:protein yellow [Aplysia californica]|uniref:Protein yellow n=1 Tax=Aplysia californica TaxID=6500 RepID=A0ABM0ZVM2_APLCA|nr:protein yellow [Aplysia californica]